MAIIPEISVIIPSFNSENYILNCLKYLKNQNFQNFEAIFVDDGSVDESTKLIKKNLKKNYKIFQLNKNRGPGYARNVGIKNANGKYIFFYDVDDNLSNNIFLTLYKFAQKHDLDVVFSDRKWIENNKNIRKGKFAFKNNRIFQNKDIIKQIKDRFYKPLRNIGVFQLTGRLIKREIILKNNIFFENNLRYLEDEAFEWDIIGNIKNIGYIRKQLYHYNININQNSGISAGILKNFKIKNYSIVKNHIYNTVKKKLTKNDAKIISNQGYIYLIIGTLISLTRSILLGKINNKIGKINRRKIIKSIFKIKKLPHILNAYKVSNKESELIVKYMKLKKIKNLEVACDLRAKEILKIRRR